MTRHVGILKSAGATIMITIREAKPLAYLLRAQVESLHLILTPQEMGSTRGTGFKPVHGNPGETGFLQYTSGSTGNPKGVVLSHANLMANVRAMGAAVSANPEDVFVSWLPLYHDLGLIGANFASLVLGFPTVLMSPLAFLSRPSSWMRAIHRHRGTMSGGPNFSFELCLRRIPDEEMEGIDLSSWRFAFNAAEPVSPDTIIEFEKHFGRFGLRKNCLSPSYGLAESSVGVAITVPGTPWRADRRGCVAVFGSRDAATGTERVVVLAEMRNTGSENAPSRHDDLKRMINDLAVSLTGAPADDILLAPPGTVPKTSSGKIRRVAAREYYERGPAAVAGGAVWLQFLRLALAGAAPQLHRGLRTLGGALFALRGYLVFALLFPF